MPDESYADATTGAAYRSLQSGPLALSRGARLMLAILGFIPLLHALAVAAPVVAAADGRLSWRLALVLAATVLYLLPPLVVWGAWRGRLPPPRADLGGRDFLWWWFSAQWQLIFNRLPWLEECMRLVPGLYSAWLRLWGARVGALVYWSPGVLVLDRQWIRIGSRVVFGVGVRLNGHAIARHREEKPALFLGAVTIGDDALIGGYSLLLPGCEVAAGEQTPPLRTLHPFSRWEHGLHTTRTEAGLAHALR